MRILSTMNVLFKNVQNVKQIDEHKYIITFTVNDVATHNNLTVCITVRSDDVIEILMDMANQPKEESIKLKIGEKGLLPTSAIDFKSYGHFIYGIEIK